MTTMTLPLPSTGSATRTVATPQGRSETHTAIRYESVASRLVSQHLASFDLVFDTPVLVMVHVDHDVDTDESDSDIGAASAISTVQQLSDQLGLPVENILRAAGIRKRTFHHWKQKPATTPRLSSQGDLWSLAQAVEVLVDRLGENLPMWMLQDRHRLKMFDRRDFTGLVRDAARHQGRLPDMASRERHMTVGTFGDDSYDLPPRGGPVHTEEAPPARYVTREAR